MADSRPGEQEIVFVGQVDLGGVFRGKGVLGHEWPYRCRWGVGWPPANLMLTPFGTLADNAFGARGDVFIVPDPATLTEIAAAPDEPPVRIALGHLRTRSGDPWDCCPRAFLEAALADLEREAGLHSRAPSSTSFSIPASSTVWAIPSRCRPSAASGPSPTGWWRRSPVPGCRRRR